MHHDVSAVDPQLGHTVNSYSVFSVPWSMPGSGEMYPVLATWHVQSRM